MDSEQHLPGEHGHQGKTKNSMKWLYVALVVLVVFASAAGGWFYYQKNNASPLPKSITKATNFALYFPSNLPTGYILDKASVKKDGGIVFYNFIKDNSTLFVSLQAKPPIAPDFQKLIDGLSFKKLDTPAGSGVIGTNIDKPTAIILTNTTLITVYGTKDVPSDIVAQTMQNLASL